MVDFLCPGCGSIDHLDGEAVTFPRQCPGCDAIVNSASDESSPQLVAEPRRKAVRVKLLRTDEWGHARPRQAVLPKAKTWAAAAALILCVGGALYAWFAWPGQAETNIPADRTSTAPTPSAPSGFGPENAQSPVRSVGNPAPAVDRDPQPAQVETSFAARNEAADHASHDENADEGETPADTASALNAALPAFGDLPAPAPNPEPAPASHISLATPLYARVPMLTRPGWSGREVEELSSFHMLLVLDKRPFHSWLHVMEINSGAEGWVRENEVRVGGGLE